MSEEWTDEQVADIPSKGIPFWVWGCGGGCLLLAIVAIVAVVFVVDKVQEATDPDVVWPKVDEILAFDERPFGYKAFGLAMGGGGGYFVMAEEKEVLAFLILGGAEDEEELDKLFSGEIETGGAFGFGGIKNVESLEVSIKGKDYRAVQFEASQVGGPASQHRGSGKGSVLLIDLSPDPSRFVMCELFDISGGATDQEDVDAFFEPFTPWGE